MRTCSPLVVVELLRDGAGVLQLQRTGIGPDVSAGQVLVHSVAGGSLFGAYAPRDSAWALVSCVVTPGFDFADWQMQDAATLRKEAAAAGLGLGEGADDAIAWLALDGERAGEDAPGGWL